MPPRAYAAAFLAIACWSSLAVATQASFQQIPPRIAMFWSFVWAAFCLGLWSLRGGTLVQEIRSTSYASLAVGLLGTFGSYYCYFQALSLAPVLEANLLNYTWPVQLVILSIVILGERFRWQTLVAVLTAAGGAFLLIGKGEWPQLSAAHSLGYLFAILSGLFWSCFSVLLRWKKAYAPSLFVSCFGAAVASLATTFHDPMLLQLSPTALLLTAYIGVVTIGIGYVAWRHAVQLGSLQVLGTFSYLTPLLSTALLVLVGTNPISLASIAGAGMVLVGAVIADAGKRST
jgi:drug/metabolite transporter (DMT)-like permease